MTGELQVMDVQTRSLAAEQAHSGGPLEIAWFEMILGLKSISTPPSRRWILFVYVATKPSGPRPGPRG